MRNRIWKISTFILAGALVVSVGIGVTLAERQHQPHMASAIKYLQRADRQLDLASADKGGHRVRAKELIAETIREVERGMRYDNRHGQD